MLTLSKKKSSAQYRHLAGNFTITYKNHGKNVKYGNVFQKIKLEMDTIIEINQPHMYMGSILIEKKDINLKSICGEYHYIKV